MKLAPLVALGVLAACEQRAPETTKPTPEPVGRWVVQPAPGGFRDVTGAEYTAVWRLDTQTGALGLCYFAAGPGLKCLLPEAALPPLGH